jgi:hypothetical protein
LQFKKNYIYYIAGAVVFVVIFGIDKLGSLFLLLGFGLGYLLHGWVNGLFTDWKNAFFTGELRKREMKVKELEQELERLKEGD